jgi:hypothetical protein
MNQERVWVVITDPDFPLYVSAIASIDTIVLVDGLVPVPLLPVDGGVLLADVTSAATLGGLPASVVYQLGAYDFEPGTRLTERYVGTVITPGATEGVQLDILADELWSFDDIVAAGNAVLDGIVVGCESQFE